MKKRFILAIFLFTLLLTCTAFPTFAAVKNITLQVNQTKQLKVNKKWKHVKWKSSKPKTVSVSAKGKIRARKTGTAVITAKSGNKTQKFRISVEKRAKIKITVNGKTFTAELENNKTAKAFMKMLPMALSMEELNGNEKYKYLDQDLPTKTYKPGTIHAGDLMLYESDCLVLFYQTFQSDYSYTKIGRILKPQGLKKALGSGNVKITLSK